MDFVAFPMLARARARARAFKIPLGRKARYSMATTNSSAKRDRSITTLRDEVDRSHQIYLAHNWLPSYRLEVGRYLTQIRAVARVMYPVCPLFPEIYCVRCRNGYMDFQSFRTRRQPRQPVERFLTLLYAFCVLFLILSAVQTVYFESPFNEFFRFAPTLIKAEIT